MRKLDWRAFAIASGMLALSGCSAPTTIAPTASAGLVSQEVKLQEQYVVETAYADRQRLNNVAWPLLAANADLCGKKVMYRIGLEATVIDDVEKNWRGAAASYIGLDSTVTVTVVAAGSPADKAGLKRGDKIVTLNGAATPTGKRASTKLGESLRAAIKDGAAVQMVVLRRGEAEPVTVSVTPVLACAPLLVMIDSPDLNAYADGTNLYVNRGMLRFAQRDEELALVLAHELGHDAFNHVEAQRKNKAAGALGGLALDVLAAAAGYNSQGAFSKAGGDTAGQAFSVEFEQEADYLGVYFMSRAGIATENVEMFWRRMAAEHPSSIYTRNSHPTAPERYLAIAGARQEVGDKKSSGMSLVPNRKPEK